MFGYIEYTRYPVIFKTELGLVSEKCQVAVGYWVPVKPCGGLKVCALGGADKERVGKVDHARVHIDVLAQFSACTRIPAQVLWHALESGRRIRWNSHRRKCLDGRKRLQMSALEGSVILRNPR